MLRFFLLMTAVLIFSPPSRHTIQIISSHPQTTTIVPEGKTFQTFLSEIDLRVWGYISGSWFGIDGPPFTETCSHEKLFYYLSLPCQCTFFPCWFLTCQSYLKHISRHPTSGSCRAKVSTSAWSEYNLFCILARFQQLYSGKSQNINQVQILRFPVPPQFLGSSVCGTVLGNN